MQLALVSSPAVQAALAERWADGAAAAQGARIANPLFSFERVRAGGALEITRTLSFGLFELLTLPARTAQARAASPSINTVQEPQAEIPQPYFVQSSPRWSRRVLPESLRSNRPRASSSGITRVTKSSSPSALAAVII